MGRLKTSDEIQREKAYCRVHGLAYPLPEDRVLVNTVLEITGEDGTVLTLPGGVRELSTRDVVCVWGSPE